jgi:hypothetical protein
MKMFEKLSPKDDNVNQDAHASSLKLVPVKRVIGSSLILLTDGTYAFILKAHAVNFDLKSQREQTVIIYAFGELLNSLNTDVPLQFLIHSKRIDTESYIREYEKRFQDPSCSQTMKAFIRDHLNYFQETVMRHNLLQREFYIVIPYNPNKTDRMSAGEAIADGAVLEGLVKGLLKRDVADEEAESAPTMMQADVANQQLSMRAGQITSHLSHLGVHSELLQEREIISLFYELFNPSIAEKQKLREGDIHSAPMVVGDNLSVVGEERRLLRRGGEE